MEPLLSAIVVWLTITFGLPASYDHPRIEFSSSEQMARLHYGAAEMEGRSEVLSLYDDTNRIIHLANSWTGKSPADLSILVHEMVHHIQNVSGIGYECPAAREAIAYEAQDQWLKLFGRNLVEEFELDRMFLKVSTMCFWP